MSIDIVTGFVMALMLFSLYTTCVAVFSYFKGMDEGCKARVEKTKEEQELEEDALSEAYEKGFDDGFECAKTMKSNEFVPEAIDNLNE